MIPDTLRTVMLIAVICYFIIILKFLKDKALSLKYTLLWIFSGFIMGILLVFPELLSYFIALVGIQSNMNGLYVLCISAIIMILMSLTSIVSRQNRKIRVLTQEMGILEKRVRDLESKSAEKSDEI